MKQHTYLWTQDYDSLEITVNRILSLGALIVTIVPVAYSAALGTTYTKLSTALIIYIGELTAPI